MTRFVRPLVVRSLKGEYPLSPSVSLEVVAFDRDGDGPVTIGPNLMSVREVDELVDALVVELESFRKDAKRALSTSHNHK